MKKIIGIFFLIVAAWMRCGATQYYVSSSAGHDDTGTGTQANPWKTFGGTGNHVNAGSFNPGDIIYLKRGDVWNEPLIPPSSGSSESPITFDAYGTGAAPVITAASAIPFVGASWTYVSGSTWKGTISTTLGSGTVNQVQFGNLYGRKQPYGSGCAGSIANKYDWCIVWPSLYVYSPNGTNPVVTYAADGTIVPIIAQSSGLAMISVVNKSWLVFQHIKVQTFDYMGVSVTGNSDNLVFANMEVDGMVPAGGTPLGFYVNAASGYGTSVQFLNDDANLNYDGFKVDAAGAVTVKNCRGYANRDAGLRDNTASGSVVNYSYSHFYGNNVAQFPTTDVIGGVAGSGNVGLACGASAGLPAGMCASNVAPVVTNFQTYPARFSFTVDDVGSAADTEDYINGFLNVFSSRGLKFNAAVVPSYPVDWASVRNWYASGNEIDSHSWSHQYYTTNLNPGNQTPYPNAPALVIQYTGAASTATLTISGTTLTTTVNGTTDLNINLGLYTALSLYQYLQTKTGYTVQQNSALWATNNWPLSRPYANAKNLAAVAGQNIKSAAYAVLYDQTKLLADEMATSKSTIEANVPGLSEKFYVYPERSDVRRTVIERLLNAAIAVMISAAIALHSHWWK